MILVISGVFWSFMRFHEYFAHFRDFGDNFGSVGVFVSF